MGMKPNPGWFKPGYDPRRHPLTLANCRKGFRIFLQNCILGRIPSRIQCSVRKKIRNRYRSKAAALIDNYDRMQASAATAAAE